MEQDREQHHEHGASPALLLLDPIEPEFGLEGVACCSSQ
jgi:hypothetical protein